MLLWAGSASADWSGRIAASANGSRVDTTTYRSIDQQYQLFTSGSLQPTIRYAGGVRFRNSQARSDDNPVSWRNEFEPNISTTWMTSPAKLTGNAVYRQSRSRYGVDQLTGQTYGLSARSRIADLPNVYGQFQWDHNVNDLELLGLDTKQQRVSAGADYTLKALYLRYNYSNVETQNRNTGLEHVSRRHTGRADYSLRLFQNALTVQPSYQGTFRDERERRSSQAEILVPIPAVAALYRTDPTPDFDSLGARAALNDGDLLTLAGEDLDLAQDVYHNFGLDFGASVTVDRIYLYTDTLANPLLSWAVFTSSDNLNWQKTVDDKTYAFSTPFLRYELTFSPQTARYVKIVMQPQPQPWSVHVTEIRALAAQTEEQPAARPVDHRGTLDLRWQPARWLSLNATGYLTQTGRSTNTQERRQQDLTAGLSMPLARLVHLAAHYQLSNVRYENPFLSRTNNEGYRLSWEASWMSTLSTRVAASRAQEWVSQQNVRKVDAYSAQLRTVVFPELRSTTEFWYSEEHRYTAGDLYTSRSLRQTLDTKPTPRSQLGAEGRWERRASRRTGRPSSRQAVSLHGSYEVTARLNLRGHLDYAEESSQTYRAWNGSASWMMTNTLSLSTSYSRTYPSPGGSNELVSVDAGFRFGTAMEWQVGLSRGRYEDTPQLDNSNLRIGFNLRF